MNPILKFTSSEENHEFVLLLVFKSHGKKVPSTTLAEWRLNCVTEWGACVFAAY